MSDEFVNTMNKLVSKNDIESLLRQHGVTKEIQDMSLYIKAFTHKSCDEQKCSSNERLEFLGDGVLECVTKTYLFHRFKREDEGFMTEKKIALVKNESIGKLSMQLGLHHWLMLSTHVEEKQLRHNLKRNGCLFEAFLGALYLDGGFYVAKTFIEHVFESYVDWSGLLLCDDNFKNILQVKIQREFKLTPDYMQLSNSQSLYHMGVFLCIGINIHDVNPKHALTFKSFEQIQMYLNSHHQVFVKLGEGIHKIKKKAEQMACEQALQIYK